MDFGINGIEFSGCIVREQGLVQTNKSARSSPYFYWTKVYWNNEIYYDIFWIYIPVIYRHGEA
jgi:hypothetical protein